MSDDPPATQWHFPSAEDLNATESDDVGLIAIGADTEPGTILTAYRHGLFPMPTETGGPMGWWSPDPRGVLPLDALHVSRSLRRSCRHFEIRVNTAFEEVIDACADPRRPHGWIDERIRSSYVRLHRMGWVHSVETWQDDQLVGGLYGVSIGGLFAGESMFHRVTDASKAALVGLVEALNDGEDRLIDVQWSSRHLESLGVQKWARSRYLDTLSRVLSSPCATVFSTGAHTLPEA